MRNWLAIVVLGVLPTPSVEAGDAMLLRVFLADGTAVVSYGEYARVADRIIFSVPLGGQADAPLLQLVNLPAAIVDWDKTTRYADSARARQYAETLGESDYTILTANVARTLNDITIATDAKLRLGLAVQARRELEYWPTRHYDYRAADVRQIVGLLDEIIGELRVAAGETRFELNLVASADQAPSLAILPAPTPEESIDQAIAVARYSDVAADRISLLTAIISTLDRNAAALPHGWMARRRRQAVDAIAMETRVEREYRAFGRQMLQAASTAAARADVVKIEALFEEVQRRDRRLGRRRPVEVEALRTALRSRLDGARALQLARDRWTIRQPAFAAYRSGIKDSMDDFARSRSSLEAIRRLAGPEASTLATLATRLESVAPRLQRVDPPEELKSSHALLLSAVKLAANAVNVRTAAIRSGSLAVAWDASAAAAGAMMLFSKACAEMEAQLTLPQLQ